MDDIPLSILSAILLILVIISAFFSSSETGMMTLNRYRLRHLARHKHRGAMRANKLLQRPDRLIGVILTGNNIVNIIAPVIAAHIGYRLWGDTGIAVATGALTLVILVFAEVAPKTFAALNPERIAFPAAYILGPISKVLYPLAWLVNFIANRLLRIVGIKVEEEQAAVITREELLAVLNEADALIPQRHQNMLLGILDLEQVTVDDVMVPRNEINGIDLEEDIDDVLEDICNSQHTLLPVYMGDINNTKGFLHMRLANRFLTEDEDNISRATILQETQDAYYIPEGTPLNVQLLHFQKEKRRIGLVVDEYGDIQGLVTLEDILEEIVGEFTTDVATSSKDIHPQEDGSYIIDGGGAIREINKALSWSLPTSGPKTLNGLMMEVLESIPDGNISLKIGNYYLESVLIKDNIIKTARARILEEETEPEEIIS